MINLDKDTYLLLKANINFDELSNFREFFEACKIILGSKKLMEVLNISYSAYYNYNQNDIRHKSHKMVKKLSLLMMFIMRDNYCCLL